MCSGTDYGHTVHSGDHWGPFGVLWEPFRTIWRPQSKTLGDDLRLILPPFSGQKCPEISHIILIGTDYGHTVHSGGHWGPLGAIWGLFEAILRPQSKTLGDDYKNLLISNASALAEQLYQDHWFPENYH